MTKIQSCVNEGDTFKHVIYGARVPLRPFIPLRPFTPLRPFIPLRPFMPLGTLDATMVPDLVSKKPRSPFEVDGVRVLDLD